MLESLAHSGVSRIARFGSREVVFDRGEQGIVYDVQGRSYVDFVLGYGPVIVGHAVPEFQTRIAGMLGHGLMMPGFTRWHLEYLSKLLDGHEDLRASIFKTGSEAVTGAFRLAAFATRKLGVIRCGYVGWHDAQLANTIRWHEPLTSPLRDQIKYTEAMRGVSSHEPVFNWTTFDLAELEAALDEHRGSIGAFIIDAYLVSLTDLATIRAALALCRKAGVVVIFDETKTGGRVSRLGVAIDTELDVDLVVLGKALANGAPISLVIGREKLLRATDQVRLGGTFSKEMFAIYAALATFDLMEAGDGYKAIADLGCRVVERFNAASSKLGLQHRVSARTVLGGSLFELVYGESLVGDEGQRKLLRRCLADHGILLLDAHPSYSCLGHRHLAWDQLERQFSEGLSAWAAEAQRAP